MDHAVLIITLLTVVAGCAQAPQTQPSPTETPTPTEPPPTAPHPSPTTAEPTTVATGPTPEPTGILGVEDGIAHSDPLPWVNATDGLNRSELRAVVSRSMARVEHLRRIEFDFDVPVEVISRTAFRAEYLDDAVDTERRTFDNGKFEALFLVGETEDSIAAQRSNLGSAVLGFYDSRDGRIVIVSNRENVAISEPVLGHELVHALQYHVFNASRYGRSTMDESNAISALLEGDARHLDRQYGEMCRANWSCVQPRAAFGTGSGGGGIPHFGLYYLRYFPYSDGPVFIDRFRRTGGLERVNALYADPPASAEQVITPAKYGNDSPTPVYVLDRSSVEWSRVRPTNRTPHGTVGQVGIAAMFAWPTFHSRAGLIVSSGDLINRDGDRLRGVDPFEYGFAFAQGWDGDTLWIHRNESGDLGYVWRIVWDSPDDAREFAVGYRQLLEHWGAERVEGRTDTWRIPENESTFSDAFALRVEHNRITIVNGPTVDQLDGIHDPAADW